MRRFHWSYPKEFPLEKSGWTPWSKLLAWIVVFIGVLLLIIFCWFFK
jgi:hypothetical protein